MGKIVLDVHRKRLETSMASIPLHQLQPIHPIDRDEARETMQRRACVVEAHRSEILERGNLPVAFLHEFLPSISNIKVVGLGNGLYVAFEGNGRLAAIREGLGPEADVDVEVELYHLDRKARKKLKRRIERVRRWNGLGPLTAQHRV